jgi:cobalt-zinc-cadmium efflux system membrane fusion protein
MFSLQICLKRQCSRFGVAAALSLAILLNLTASSAHEGHDHGDKESSAQVSAAYPRVVARSEVYEIVGILKDQRLSIYVDDAITNEPIAGATLEVTVGDSAPVNAEEVEAGVYAVAMPSLKTTGSVEVIFAISAKKGDDLLVDSFTPIATVGEAVHDHNLSTVLAAARDKPFRSPAVPVALALAMMFVAIHMQRRRRTGFALFASAIATTFAVTAALSFVNHDHPAIAATPAAQALSDSPRRLPDGTAFAAKPTQRLLDVRTSSAESQTVRPAFSLIGRVIGDPNRTSIVQSVYGGRVVLFDGKLPRIGQQVAKGEPLIQIEPHLPLADRTTIIEKVGEIEQLIAGAEARIRRLRPLAERGAVPQSQVNDLEIELEGLRARREAVRNSRADREVLFAPTDGVITAAKVTPGQVIQPQDVLLQIADPKGLWVEALAYGDVNIASSSIDATAIGANGTTMPLSYLGLSRELRQHASVVHFAIPEPPPGLNIGQPVTVLMQSGVPANGLILPREAIVRSANGESIVWLHVAPERFEPRPVRTQSVDAGRVVVAAGLKEQERAVVRGADLINQIR